MSDARGRLWCCCWLCGTRKMRTRREDGTLKPCPCGGTMRPSLRHQEKRIAVAKEDLQRYRGVSDTEAR